MTTVNRATQRAHDDAVRSMHLHRAHETRAARIARRMNRDNDHGAIADRDHRHIASMIKLHVLRALRLR